MRILLTGATGSLGRAVLSRLVEDGHELRCITRQPRPDQERVRWVLGNLRNIQWEPVIESCDAVIHLAALAHRRVVRQQDIQETNVLGTKKLVIAGLKAGIAPHRILYASSVAVYGLTRAIDTDETASPRPLTAYAAAKFDAEQFVVNVGGVALRMPACYGPSALGGVASLIQVVKLGIVGQHTLPNTPRSLLSVHNAAAAFAAALRSGVRGAFNVTDDHDVELRTLIGWLERLCDQGRRPLRVLEPVVRYGVAALSPSSERPGKRSRILDTFMRAAQPLTFSSRKFKRLTGYAPNRDVRSLIAETVGVPLTENAKKTAMHA